ncbi:MAG: sigma 54-interacting transcriptional regulator, partial [Nitrospira sp.]|nr:sigma 54-interacting transcriptional regulator [Nitrospira sp.]
MIERDDQELTCDLTRELQKLHDFQVLTTSLLREESEQRIAQEIVATLSSLWGKYLWLIALRPAGPKDTLKVYGFQSDNHIDKDLQEFLMTVGSLWQEGRNTFGESYMPVAFRHLSLQAVHIFPVRTIEKHLGALLLGTYDTMDPPLEQVAALNTLTSHLALVLETARLRHAYRTQILKMEEIIRERTAQSDRKDREQYAIHKIHKAVSAHLERDSLFEAISGAVRNVVSFDWMGILLPDPPYEDFLTYIIQVERNQPQCNPITHIPQAGTVAAWVLEHKQPFMAARLEDLRPFPICYKACMREGIQSHCALPLLIRNQAVGVLIFASRELNRYGVASLPFLEELAAAISVALDNCLTYEGRMQLVNPLPIEDEPFREPIKISHVFGGIVGQSPVMQGLLNRMMMVAGTDSSVLICGETGTGKELVAKAIYELSQRREKPLITVNCAALPVGII